MGDKLLCVVEFDESPIPDETFRRLDEVTVRKDGCVWRIHRNDADPFPSNPHAHNLESGLKLDLRTGGLFFGAKATGKLVSGKALAFIRAEAEAKGVAMPLVAR